MGKDLNTVLIVDNEPTICQGINTSIDWNGLGLISAGCAYSGETALKIIRKIRPSIIITDIRMPGMSGIEMMKKAREENIDSDFIIISAYEDFSYAKEALTLGAKDYLLKPFQAKSLNQLLSRIIKQKENSITLDASSLRILKQSQKREFCLSLIESHINDNESIDREIENLGLNIKNEEARIAVISHDGTHDFNELSHIISKNMPVAGTEQFKINATRIGLIFNTRNISDISLYFKHIYETVKKGYPELRFGIGKEIKSLADAEESYNSSLIALSYRIYNQNRIIFNYDEIPASSATGTSPVDYSGYDELFAAICQQNRDKIKELTDEFFSLLFYIPEPPPSYVKGKCLFLISDMQNRIRNVFHAEDKDFEENIDIVSVLSMSLLRSSVAELLIEYAEGVIPRLRAENDPIIHHTKQYIENHINEFPTASQIADKVSMNSQYFPIYFREKAGITLRDFIIKTKCELAKKLLMEDELSVQEISQHLGYSDIRSFIRAFKKYSDMTPTEYQRKFRPVCR